MDNRINKEYMIHLDFYVQDCEAEFYFNDIPVRKTDDSNPFHSMNAHMLLLDGVNKMEILIYPNGTPSTARVLFDNDSIQHRKTSPKACMKLVKYPVGSYTGDDLNSELLMQLNFESERIESSLINYPYSQIVERNLGEILGSFMWAQTQKIDFALEIQEIHSFVQDIYNAFIQGDSDALIRRMDPALKTIYKALPAYGEQRYRADLANDIKSNASLHSIAPTYDAKNTDFRLCFNGRIVQLINKDWTNTIKAPKDNHGIEYSLSAFIGKINGEWHIVMVL